MEPWMNLADVRRWFANLKRMEPGSMVGDSYVTRACEKGLPFHRDPVTDRRYWLESELSAFVRASQENTKNLRLRQRPGRKAV